jgi:hypothetical protein
VELIHKAGVHLNNTPARAACNHFMLPSELRLNDLFLLGACSLMPTPSLAQSFDVGYVFACAVYALRLAR